MIYLTKQMNNLLCKFPSSWPQFDTVVLKLDVWKKKGIKDYKR